MNLHCWNFLFSMLVRIRVAIKTFYIVTENRVVHTFRRPIEPTAATDDYYTESDKTRSTGSLIIIILSIFSSCTIGIVTTMSDREYRKRRGGGWVASSGACPAPVSLACFYHSSVLFVCVCVWCRHRSQWKRLARRPLIWPCKVSGARLMKTLFYTYIYHIPGKTIRVGLRRAGILFIFCYDFFPFLYNIYYIIRFYYTYLQSS